MRKRIVPLFIALLLVLTIIAAAWHLTSRASVPENAVCVVSGSVQTIVHADDLPLQRIQGEIVNGKGETISIDAQGTPLSALLNDTDGCTSITVRASDEYTADLAADEFDRACIILQEDGGLRLIVFGDPDSRRSVRNLTEVIVQ